MRHIKTLIVAFASGAALTAGAAFADTTGPTEQSALAADASFSRALAANDTKTLRGILASDWIVVSANGGWDGRACAFTARRPL